MAKIKDSVVIEFGKLAKKRFSPCKVILFGSRAKNMQSADSDYDFLLISPQFKKWEWEERSAKAYRLKRNIPAAMDILCLTPDEFTKKRHQIGVVLEAVRDGIVI